VRAVADRIVEAARQALGHSDRGAQRRADALASCMPWTCAPRHDGSSTFAHHTCTVRWPRILTELAAKHLRHASALTVLRNEVLHGDMTGLPTSAFDRGLWEEALSSMLGRPWTQAPWYAAEAFLYRRILEATGYFAGDGGAERAEAARRADDEDDTNSVDDNDDNDDTDDDDGADPFFLEKCEQEEKALARLAASAHDVGTDGQSTNDDTRRRELERRLRRSLWSNRVDLSLPVAKELIDVAPDDLLHDDSAAVLGTLRPGASVAIALDNAGDELVSDLLLASELSSQGVAVSLWAKPWPFFVSDATVRDVRRATTRLRAQGHIVPTVRVRAPLALGGPGFFDEHMPHALRREWARHDLVIAKGDCTYRRLVSDAPFDRQDRRSFGQATASLPAPVLAVRTLKAEVLVGVAADVVARAERADPHWLVSGRYGVIQAGGRGPIAVAVDGPGHGAA
jgi:uncharacterized protein with ATP-grasp and redox domains